MMFAASAPSRGTPLSDLVPASICAVLGLVLVLAIAVGHRRGAFTWLACGSEKVERVTGIPGWSIIPNLFGSAALLVAAFGYYWDVSWHIDRGRDPGPFANPAHWFIIVGLAGIALAGVLAIVLGDERSAGSSLPVRPGWNVPVGGVLLTLCGVVALAGFPLDDVWHRLFGQDVTAWGPTHIQMIGGASLATLALWTLAVEGQRVAAASGRPVAAWQRRANDIVFGGAFLIGLSTLQVEFDFGVPQFRQVNHPLLIMLAASIGLVAVRIRAGRGAALGAASFFVVVRAILAVVIAGALGRSLLHFPLYLVEALLVEAVAFAISTKKPVQFGLFAGAAIGTIGLAFETFWSHVFMPLPWHASLFPEAAIVGVVAALAGGVIGGLVGRALTSEPGATSAPVTPRGLALLASVAAVGCLAWSVPMGAAAVRADITVEAVQRGAERWGNVTVTLDPPNAAKKANWFQVLAWQGRPSGDDGLVLANLREVRPGTYRADQPVPLSGTWKSIVRLHSGHNIEALPLYLPADTAIPAAAVTTDAHVTRAFARDKTILQREAVGGSVGLQRGAYAVLASIAVLWILSMAWGLRRLARATEPTVNPPPKRSRRTPALDGAFAPGRA
jgi:hypothetical protein